MVQKKKNLAKKPIKSVAKPSVTKAKTPLKKSNTIDKSVKKKTEISASKAVKKAVKKSAPSTTKSVKKPVKKAVVKKAVVKKTPTKKAVTKTVKKVAPKAEIKKKVAKKPVKKAEIKKKAVAKKTPPKKAELKVKTPAKSKETAVKQPKAEPKKAGRKKLEKNENKKGKLTRNEARNLLAQARANDKPIYTYKVAPTPKLSVKSILITQAPPPPGQKSPYIDIVNKYNIKVDFRSFTEIKGIDAREFRRLRINLADFTAVIFTSKSAIENYFRIAEEVRFKVPEDTKYFCKSEAVALYLQKFIQFRKRKVFYGNGSQQEFEEHLMRFKDIDSFLFPCSEIHQDGLTKFLEDQNFKFQKAVIFNTVASDLSDLENVFYDMIVFFTPMALQSLFQNFPKFKQNKTRLAAFGNETCQAVFDAKLGLNIAAPTPESPSMAMAIEKYIKMNN